jgi:RNA polymerase sigma-70 factor, ECF subfamily
MWVLPMTEPGWLAEQFERNRPHLQAVAYSMLGSVTEAEDAVQRRVVDAFLAAARAGDFAALVEVLDPDVVFRMDPGPASPLARPPLAGAGAVAGHVLSTAPRFVNLSRPVLVNGEAGALFGTHDDPVAVIGFTIVDGRIAELNLVADPAKLRHLEIEP